MPRSTGGPTHARKRKRILKRASGFRAGPGTIYRQALEFTRKADVYAYRDRRQKKRELRRPEILFEGHARNMRKLMGIGGKHPNAPRKRAASGGAQSAA